MKYRFLDSKFYDMAGWLAGCAALRWLAGWLRWLACWLRWLAALAGWLLGDSFGPCWAHSFGPWARALLWPFIWALGPGPLGPFIWALGLGPLGPFKNNPLQTHLR